MKRIAINERANWRQRAHEYGFDFHSMYGKPYWCEEAYYHFSLSQIDYLEAVTAELQQMCLQVVEKVVASESLLARCQIPEHAWDLVRSSWRNQQPSLYSRLDLAWSGEGEAKLLENNADTPTSLYEAAFFQWLWLEDQLNAQQLPKQSDQFNSIQEKLIARFAELKRCYGFSSLYFTCCRDSEEDRATIQYLQDCATEAELPNTFLFIEDVGLGQHGEFTDLDDHVIDNVFKLYPWEFMLREAFATNIADAGVRWLEPAWKAILSNKALLPLLWQMFPNHPNLLPAWFGDEQIPHLDKYVVKPLFSREGANITIVEQGREIARVDGPYGAEGNIIQQFYPLPCFDGNYTLIGSWLVDDKPAGIGLREDNNLITQNLSRFYPHIFTE